MNVLVLWYSPVCVPGVAHVSLAASRHVDGPSTCKLVCKSQHTSLPWNGPSVLVCFVMLYPHHVGVVLVHLLVGLSHMGLRGVARSTAALAYAPRPH